MMVDIAKLSIEVDSSQVEASVQRLKKMPLAGKNAQIQSAMTGAAINKMAKQFGLADASTSSLNSELVKINKSSNSSLNAFVSLASKVNNLDKELKAGKLTADEYRTAVTMLTGKFDNAIAPITSVETATKKLGAVSNKTSRAMGGFGQKAGQAGIQVQQLVGQVQGGVDPMIALAQQSADLGFVLGFPLLGAVTGIAASFAGPLVNALLATSDAAEQAKDSVNDVIEGLERNKKALLSLQIEEITDELKELSKQEEELRNKKFISNSSFLGADITGSERAKFAADTQKELEAIAKRRLDLEEAQIAIQDKLNKKEIESKEALDDTKASLVAKIAAMEKSPLANRIAAEQAKLSTDATKEQREEIAKLVTELDKLETKKENAVKFQRLVTTIETETLTETDAADAQLKARREQLKQLAATDEEYRRGEILAEQAHANKIADIKQKQADRERQQRMDTLGATENLFGTLAQIAQAGGEEQFNTWKRLAQAQAAISASLAVLSVLDDQSVPTAIKPVLAGSIAALAAVQIAQIDQTQYSRELGGQVKAGEQYLVGERGPEVLTMGSDGHITANKDTGSVDQTLVFQISTGVSQTVKAEIMSLMPVITKTAISASKAIRR